MNIELSGAIKGVKVTKPGVAEVAFVVRLPGVTRLMAQVGQECSLYVEPMQQELFDEDEAQTESNGRAGKSHARS